MGILSPQISTKVLVPMCRQLSTSFDAGIPIVRTLELVADQTRNRRAREVMRVMRDDIIGGATLGAAARRQSKYLPTFFVELVASGEIGGRLDTMLKDLGQYYEDRLEMRRSIMRVLSYPIIQLWMAWFLGTFALRLIQKIGTAGFNLNEYFRDYVRFQSRAGVLFAAFVIASILLARLGIFQWILGSVTTHLWPISAVTRRFALARFFRTFALLISSGIHMPICIDRAASVAGNPYIARDLRKAIPTVKDGGTLVAAFASCTHLTPTAREMLRIGEESGELDKLLRKVADYHLAEGEHAVRVAAKFMQTMIILAVGMLVGYIVIQFYTGYMGRMLDGLGV